MNVSSGFISELSMVSLCYGLLHAALEIEHGNCDDCGATKRSADYKVTKQLDRRISKLKDELLEFLHSYSCLAKKVKTRNEKLFKYALSHINENVQLDYLAVMILHLRFAENERNGRPLADEFKWIIEKEGQLFAIMDLLSGTEAGSKEGEMFKLACKIKEDL